MIKKVKINRIYLDAKAVGARGLLYPGHRALRLLGHDDRWSLRTRDTSHLDESVGKCLATETGTRECL